MKILFNKYGASLGTRHLGRIVKKDLDDIFMETDDIIILDFNNVNIVTNSFADEVFGTKIAEIGFEEFKKRTTFVNLTPFLSMCIKKAIMNRLENLLIYN